MIEMEDWFHVFVATVHIVHKDNGKEIDVNNMFAVEGGL